MCNLHQHTFMRNYCKHSSTGFIRFLYYFKNVSFYYYYFKENVLNMPGEIQNCKFIQFRLVPNTPNSFNGNSFNGNSSIRILSMRILLNLFILVVNIINMNIKLFLDAYIFDIMAVKSC